MGSVGRQSQRPTGDGGESGEGGVRGDGGEAGEGGERARVCRRSVCTLDEYE